MRRHRPGRSTSKSSIASASSSKTSRRWYVPAATSVWEPQGWEDLWPLALIRRGRVTLRFVGSMGLLLRGLRRRLNGWLRCLTIQLGCRLTWLSGRNGHTFRSALRSEPTSIRKLRRRNRYDSANWSTSHHPPIAPLLASHPVLQCLLRGDRGAVF